MNQSVRVLAAVDVCDTLYRSNTTFDFIGFALEMLDRRWQAAWYRAMTNPRSVVTLALKVIEKLTGVEVAKALALLLLRGVARETLQELAHVFVDQRLASREIVESHRLVGALRQTSHHIVLTSASLEPVVQAVAKHVGADDVIATQLCYDASGQFTGGVAEEVRGRKHVLLRVRYPNARIDTVVTDNRSDRSLVEEADCRYVVVYNASDRAFWKPLQPWFIEP